MCLRLPTFLIAGASKSGTTSLWRYLSDHPAVFMASMKEPLFFTNIIGQDGGGDAASPTESGRYCKGLHWYASLFRGCPKTATAIGEASNIYMMASDAPGLIRRHIPQVKLIFVLRHPVDRIYSHYWFDVKRAIQLPDFPTMVERRHPRFLHYKMFSRYKEHLTRYLTTFSEGQIMVLIFDDLIRHTLREVQKVFQFLGVDPGHVPGNIANRYNESGMVRSAVLHKFIGDARVARVLKTFLPHAASRQAAKVKGRIRDINIARTRYPAMDDSLRRKILQEYHGDIEFVEALSGRDLSAWRS